MSGFEEWAITKLMFKETDAGTREWCLCKSAWDAARREADSEWERRLAEAPSASEVHAAIFALMDKVKAKARDEALAEKLPPEICPQEHPVASWRLKGTPGDPLFDIICFRHPSGILLPGWCAWCADLEAAKEAVREACARVADEDAAFSREANDEVEPNDALTNQTGASHRVAWKIRALDLSKIPSGGGK